jgi:tRNA G18 (ribose-2'-O)-methylase SpoU
MVDVVGHDGPFDRDPERARNLPPGPAMCKVRPMTTGQMRGYFGVGVDTISKAGNVGALMRTSHAFGASFMFLVSPAVDWREIVNVDTSDAAGHLPVWEFPSPAAVDLPKGCAMVGVELTDDAIDLPSFRHPTRAAYVLGPEKGSLSPEMIARCDFVVKIPTKFCVNVGLAGALVMYDRMICLGRYAERPVRTGGPVRAVRRE